MRPLILGAGAVGGYLGLELGLAGAAVAFVGRPQTAAAITASGLTLIDGQAQRRLPPAPVFDRLAPAVAEHHPDLILLTIKAYDLASTAAALAAAPSAAPVVCFLNGIGAEAQLAQAIGHERVIAATLTSAVERPSPATIVLTRRRGLGLQGGSQAADKLAAACRQAGLRVSLFLDPQAMKWSKLLTNLMGGAIPSLTGLSVDEVYAHSGLYRLERAVLREAIEVVDGLGLRLVDLPGAPIRALGLLMRLPPGLSQPLLRRVVAGGRGGKRPSLYWDVERGRTEIDWLNGAVAAGGIRLGLPTPANKLLTEAVHALTAAGGRQSQAGWQAESLLAQASVAGVAGLSGYNRPGPGSPAISSHDSG